MNQTYLTDEIAKKVQGRVFGSTKLPIAGIKTLRQATAEHIALYLPSFGETLLEHTQAGCVVLSDETLTARLSCSVIVVPTPLDAMKVIAELFLSVTASESQYRTISTTAIIHQSAQLDLSVSVGDRTLIAESVKIGTGTVIGSGVNIGSGVTIGGHVHIEDNVTIGAGCLIADKVNIASGAVIAAKPYQYIKTKGTWHESHAYGGVSLGADCYIGANSVIERGIYADTTIASGAKIGPLVQIAHDVSIGRHTAIISHAAIGSNTVIGEHCIVGGGCLISSALNIASDTVFTGGGIVTRSISKSGVYSSGVNVKPHQRWRKNLARLHQLDTIVKRLRRLEFRVKAQKEDII